MEKVDNVVSIPVGSVDKVFRYWLEFLKPFHKLTDREMDVLACFLKHRYELGKVVKDLALLDQILMNEDTRRQIREECNITQSHFQVVMTSLRKNKVVSDNKINPRFIPRIKEDSHNFQLLLMFTY